MERKSIRVTGPCACMGPQRGDPFCYCEMIQKGLTPTPMSKEESDRLDKQLAEIFDWRKNGKSRKL